MSVGHEKYAYVSIITNGRYLEGCSVLYDSLKWVGAEFPFYVLMPKNIDPEVVQQLKAKQINCLFADDQYQSYAGEDNKRLYWTDTVFKLEVFNLVQFDKIVFLDADMIVLKNIDSLFSKPHMSAVIAGKSCNPNWVSLNSGLMVIEPNVKDYVGLLACIEGTYKSRDALGYNSLQERFHAAPLRSRTQQPLFPLALDSAYIQLTHKSYSYHSEGQPVPYSTPPVVCPKTNKIS